MKLPVRLVAVFLPALLLAPHAYGQFARFVDPLLGASGGGNVFPGAVVPFGMIKPGPDMAAPEGHDPNAGWNATKCWRRLERETGIEPATFSLGS